MGALGSEMLRGSRGADGHGFARECVCFCCVLPEQVARVCVSALFQPAACRRTVEMFSVAGGAALDDSDMWQLSLR
jgi:hypothetical protein